MKSNKLRNDSVPAKALMRERSKSLELEFPPSYSYSSTISCCSVGSQPPRTTEMSVVILSIGPTAHCLLTPTKGGSIKITLEINYIQKFKSIVMSYYVYTKIRIAR